MERSNIKIVFFGTTDFVIPTLEHLNDKYKISAVVTRPDKPAGRDKSLTPPPIKIAAKSLGIPVLQPDKLRDNPEFLEKLKDTEADIGIVAAYGKIIPLEILKLPKHGFMNIHPSLLPSYRGPSPVQAAILNGDQETGVSIMVVDKEMDHGPIITSGKVTIGDKKFTELNNELWQLGTELLVKILPEYLKGGVEITPQDDSKATYYGKIRTEDGEILPNDTVKIAYNKVRALNPDPGTYFWIDNGNKKIRLKILDVDLLNGEVGAGSPSIGMLKHDSMPLLKLNGGALILNRVQPEGKKVMSGKDFLSGYRQLFNG